MKKILLAMHLLVTGCIFGAQKARIARSELAPFDGKEKLAKVCGSMTLVNIPIMAEYSYLLDARREQKKLPFNQLKYYFPEVKNLDIRVTTVVDVEFDFGENDQLMEDFKKHGLCMPIQFFEDFINKFTNTVEIVYKPVNKNPILVCLATDKNVMKDRGITTKTLNQDYEHRLAFLNGEVSKYAEDYVSDDEDYVSDDEDDEEGSDQD